MSWNVESWIVRRYNLLLCTPLELDFYINTRHLKRYKLKMLKHDRSKSKVYGLNIKYFLKNIDSLLCELHLLLIKLHYSLTDLKSTDIYSFSFINWQNYDLYSFFHIGLFRKTFCFNWYVLRRIRRVSSVLDLLAFQLDARCRCFFVRHAK